MKSGLSFFLLLLIEAGALAQDGIKFQDWSLDEALEKAKSEEKLIFINVYTEWCDLCASMHEYIFSDEEVATFFNDQFISIHLDAETTPGYQLSEIYQVSTFPSFLFVNWKGELVQKGCGGLDTKAFLDLARLALDPQNRLIGYQLRYEKNKRDPRFLAEFSILLNEACIDNGPFLKSFFEELPKEEWLDEPAWTVLNFNVMDPYNEQFRFLLDHREEFAARYGRDTVDEKIFSTFYGQFVDIYNAEDLTLFATQSLRSMVDAQEFGQKDELMAMLNVYYAEQVNDWQLYGKSVVEVVKTQEITDPEQLNEFAWKFYVNITDQSQLMAAKAWMEQILSEYVDATFMDTYASLLFKLGEVKEAIKWEKLALQSARLVEEDLEHYQLQLELFRRSP